MATKVITGLVRMSYMKVFTPDDDGKFSTSILVPKSDVANYAKLKAAEDEAFEEGVKKLWGGKRTGIKRIIRDGDLERPDDPAYAGHWFINCNTRTKPEVIDKNKNAITDPLMFVSGDYGRTSLNFYPYAADGNKSLGVGCGLNNLQMIRKGEPLGSVTRAEDDFNDDFEDEDPSFGEDDSDPVF